MKLKNFNYRSHRLLFVVVAAVVVTGLTIFPFTNASCRTTQTRPGDADAMTRLRALAHQPTLPAEAVFERIENENRGTTVGALARFLRARVKSEIGNDHAGAARLLDDVAFESQTAIADYVLFTRAAMLDKAGRTVEARGLYERLARDNPQSRRARAAILRAAEIMTNAEPTRSRAGVALFVEPLLDRDDPAALLLVARAAESEGDTRDAITRYRRILFYAPAAKDAGVAQASLTRLAASTAPVSSEEASARADRLFAARRFNEAFDAYTEAFRRFPALAVPGAQLKRGTSAANARRVADAASALRSIPLSAGETHAEALGVLATAQARAKLFAEAQTTLDELRRLHPRSTHTRDALVRSGEAARDAKNNFYAQNFFRTAVATFPGAAEVAGAQFELAWAAHEAGRFDESARLLVEHLANYADRNTDNRGRAGYWAARDTERAGRTADARKLYEAMLVRYGANWYGYLAAQRLDAMKRAGTVAGDGRLTAPEVARAAANLSTITVGENTIDADDERSVTRAAQLGVVGLDDYAFDEFDALTAEHPTDPRVQLARAQLHRARGENVEALTALRRSYPDYSQMNPEEMTTQEWDIFYPLDHWATIKREARAKNLDPYTVAGLIRQESVFNPRAASHANAYGLMQLLVPTARAVARRYGVDRTITSQTLFDPELNIRLGTGYMRDQFDEFGRLEYVAAAYNAGPGRPRQWRNTLPLQIDEWTESIPFRETRGYVQGVTRNMLQYRRLYDEQGRLRPEVGTRPSRSQATIAPRTNPTLQTPAPGDEATRPRRASEPGTEDER